MQSALPCNALKRCRLKHTQIIIPQIVKYCRLSNHKSAVDPSAVFFCLFDETIDPICIIVNIQHAKSAARLNCCHRHHCFSRLAFMRIDQVMNIDITDTIAISQHKRLIANIFLYALDACACLCIQPRINECHFPRF